MVGQTPQQVVIDAETELFRRNQHTIRLAQDRARLEELVETERTGYERGTGSLAALTSAGANLSALTLEAAGHTARLQAAEKTLEAAQVAATKAERLAELVSLAENATVAQAASHASLSRIGAVISAELPVLAGGLVEHDAARQRLEILLGELGAQRPNEYGSSEAKARVDEVLPELVSLTDLTALLTPPVPVFRPMHGDKQHPGWPPAFVEARGKLDQMLASGTVTFLPAPAHDPTPLTGESALAWGKQEPISGSEALEISRKANGGEE